MSFFSPGAGRGYFWAGLSNALENIYKTNKVVERYELMKDRDKYLNELMKNRLNEEYSLKKDLASQNFEYKKQLQDLKNRLEYAKTEGDFLKLRIELLKVRENAANDNKLLQSGEYKNTLNSIDETVDYIDNKLKGYKNFSTNQTQTNNVNTQNNTLENINNFPNQTNSLKNYGKGIKQQQPIKPKITGGFET